MGGKSRGCNHSKMKNQLNNKRIEFSLAQFSPRDNSFAIMNAWKYQAQKEGWTEAEIFTVLDEATLGNRQHLIDTLQLYSESLTHD
jgi:hypothetical protein